MSAVVALVALALLVEGPREPTTPDPQIHVDGTDLTLVYSRRFTSAFAPSTVHLLVARTGDVLASDRSNYVVEIHSPSRSGPLFLGSRGAGPGEFTSLDAVSLGASDSLFVLDWRSQRISVFASTPSWHFSYAFRPVLHRSGIAAYVLSVGGSDLFALIEPTAYDGSEDTRLARVDRWGTITKDSILTIPREPFHVITYPGGESHVRVPFSHRSFVGPMGEDRLFVASSAQDYVHVVSPLGQVRQRRLGFERPEVTMADDARARGEWAASTNGALRLRVFEEAKIPKYHPYYEDLLSDGQTGALWFRILERSAIGEVWTVLEPNGSKSRLRLPERRYLKSVSQDLLYTVVLGEDDVLSLEVYRLREE